MGRGIRTLQSKRPMSGFPNQLLELDVYTDSGAGTSRSAARRPGRCPYIAPEKATRWCGGWRAGHFVERDAAEGAKALEAGGRDSAEEVREDGALGGGQVGGAEDAGEAAAAGPVENAREVAGREIGQVVESGWLAARWEDVELGARIGPPGEGERIEGGGALRLASVVSRR